MFTTQALTPQTWPAYSDLIERNRGVWGGCWCMGFHPKGPVWGRSAELNRAEKQARVWTGTAHAALVFDGNACLGWAQYGAPAEVPRIKNRKEYDKGLGTIPLPDWRITCFFVDTTARGRGVADAALEGALKLIAAAGGGVVEGYPDVVTGKVSSSFLFHGTASSFERQGFQRQRAIGKTRVVMRREVAAMV